MYVRSFVFGQNTQNTLEHNRNQTKPKEFIKAQQNKAKQHRNEKSYEKSNEMRDQQSNEQSDEQSDEMNEKGAMN